MTTDNDRTRAAAIRAANASDRLHARAKLYGAIREILTLAATDAQKAAIDLEDAAWHLAGCPTYPATPENLRAQPVAPVPAPAPTPGPLPMPECRDDGPTPTADADDGAAEVVSSPAADAPPPLDAPAPAPSARGRRGRRRSEGDGQTLAPDAATEAEAVEQVAQVMGDAPRDVSGDLFGDAPAPAADDFLPL